MLKRISASYTSNKSIPFLITGISSASKVIPRPLSNQGIEVAGKWDLFSAVCLERHPVITKPMQDIEARYHNMLRQIEAENSIDSDYDTRRKKEERRKGAPMDNNVTSSQTLQDLEDLWEEELAKFELAPRISENRGDDAIVSLNRKLDKSLLLLVEQKIGNAHVWIPPQTIRKDNETMIQTAHRSLQELCGNDIMVKFYGNAPIGFYQYTYPSTVRKDGRNGAKIFYFLARYISGNVAANVKHGWLDRVELEATTPPKVHAKLSKFLLAD